MNKQLKAMIEELTSKIQNSYEEGVSMEDAERLAGKTLHLQLLLADELKTADLSARMKKSGVKAVKAAIYLDEAGKTEKKPSDTFLQAKVDVNDLVVSEQTGLDDAEVNRDHLNHYVSVFKEAHIHFRSIAKGTFGG